jgi:hypothetical protein
MKKIIIPFLFLPYIVFSETITFGSPVKSLEKLVLVILNYLFTAGLFLATILIVYAGILMITSSGNEEQFAKGKRLIVYAILGLVLVIMGRGIVDLIKNYLLK